MPRSWPAEAFEGGPDTIVGGSNSRAMHLTRARRAGFSAVLVSTVIVLLAGCGTSGTPPRRSANATLRLQSPSGPSVPLPVSTSATAVSCIEPAARVIRIVGRPLDRAIKSTVPGLPGCGYYQVDGRGMRTFIVSFTPFPSKLTSPTLGATRKSLRAIVAMGTAQQRAHDRIISEPAWGSGAFVQATLVDGLPGGTQEQVDAYTAHWIVSLTIITSRYLASHELSWMNSLVAALPS